MASDWQAPKEWQQDGSIISGVSPLKTGAWTSMLSAKETRNGKEIDVVIKTFSAPQEIVDDPQRVAREREKFIAAARLQKQLTDAHAGAWVPILRISEDPQNTSFSMQKLGASLQDLLDRKVHLSAKDLYEITMSIIQGFEELMIRHKRSHGSLKASDVISVSGGSPPYRLADPAATGESHSANDLYALGLILFQLIEHKEWDPLTPIIPTSNWARFGGQRDRWIQFLNMLLAPNGCQQPLLEVRRLAVRLKPGAPVRNFLLLAAAGVFFLVVVGAVGLWFAWPHIKALMANRGGGGGQGGVVVAPTIDPTVKADWDKAHDAYLALTEKWTARERTDRYDHAKSTETYRAGRALITEIQLTDTAAYQKSADAYGNAAVKIQEALELYVAENKAGQQQDAEALVDFQKASDDFTTAKRAWDEAAGKFDPKHDHTRSTAIAQATALPPSSAPADAAGRRAAAEQNRAAAVRFAEALALAKTEEAAGKTVEQAKADFNEATAKYQAGKDAWESASVGITFDIGAAKAAADRARAGVPTNFVLTDVPSYQKATDALASALGGYQEAMKLLDQAKKDHNASEADAETSMKRAAEAMDKKDYAGALAWYRRAADLNNPDACFNVGLFYEIGRGTDKNTTEAAKWYQKAADASQSSAMVNLGLLYESGNGVTKDTAKAMELYRKAADQKNVAAMRNIGYLYDNGIGVTRDSAQALTWYRKGADLSDPSSTYLVGVAYEQGKGVGVDYKQALDWYTKAADLKYSRAMNSIGVLYEMGRGVKQDPGQAMTWYKKAADLNYGPAMSNVGALYDNGVGVPVDHAEALKWFRKGAELGHAMSMYNLAVLYEMGRGTTTDLGQALDWYRKAAASDDPQARRQALDRLNSLGFSP